MREEVVYVIGTPGSRMVKIGRSTNVQQRLTDIQNMSPVPLELLWTTAGGHYLETRLHWHFSELRSHGEWFQFESDPVLAVRTAVAEEPWARPMVGTPQEAAQRQLAIDSNGPLAEALEQVSSILGETLSQVYLLNDPAERAAAIQAHNLQTQELKRKLKEIEQGCALELKEGRSWRQVGSMLGLSGARAEQISKGK
ncbi:GIY-YIG nuclease family protein [Streptomyces sp. NPDC005531]|uniref:GIY-YIG nuclease family protein n=1 Tax=Streptomyces sp. NPDC005531 TaxID=3364722 RepID=UPI0036C8839D